MPRETKQEMLMDRNDPNAPFLFDEENLPTCVAVLKAVQEKRYEHTGARLLDDDGRALQLVEMLLNRVGVKKIAETMRISKATVRAARRALVAQGKLDPYKQRVIEGIEDAITAGIDNYRDALEKNAVPAAQIPIGVGILFDKRALMLGEPTAITGKTVDQDLSEDKLNAWLEKLPRANATVLGEATNALKGASTDSESTDKPPKGQ